MAYIYKITNQINGKSYIGKTLCTIQQRWQEHLNALHYTRYEKRPLYQAMVKYGVENFTIEEVEECSYKNVNEREKYWIEYYQAFQNGYNATTGGDGTQYADYHLIYSLYQEGKDFQEIRNLTKYDIRTIDNALDAYGITQEQRIKNATMRKWKSVAKIDLKTKEIIEVYSSISEAERMNGNTHHISDVCKGTRKSCKGFGWRYI